MPDVWCVIPHYGDDALLAQCLDSLKRLDYPEELFNESRIIVINNNPPNDNLLYTGSINKGIRKIQDAYCEAGRPRHCVVWLLNNDTMVDKNCIAAAVNCFQSEGWESTGIVGSKNVRMDNPDFISWGGSGQCMPYGKHKHGYVSKGDLSVRTEEEWATFACLFLNFELISEIGLLDKNMRHVCSDSDYCFRARAQGWKCFYEPDSIVQHVVNASHKSPPLDFNNIVQNDKQYFFRKWISYDLYNSLTSYPFSPARN